MPADLRSKAEAFKATIEQKIKSLVAEFGEGKISREQFHVLYERYSGKIAIANHAIMSGNPDAVQIANDGLPTIAIRSELMGKAMGLMVYHHRSGSPVETLGEFNIPKSEFMPMLHDISMLLSLDKFVERQVKQVVGRHWLVIVTGRYTSVVTEFRNEPSQVQYVEIERLHRDFENANRITLEKAKVDSSKLAYPFIIFLENYSKM